MSDAFVVRKPGFRIGSSFRVSFSGNGSILATVGKRVTEWNVGERMRVASVHPFSHESEIDVSLDGKRIVVKNTLGDVVVLESGTLSESLRLQGRDYGEGGDIRFSPCGKFLVDSSWNGDLLVRSATSGRVVLREPGDRITKLASTADRLTWVYNRGDRLVVRHWPFLDNRERMLPGSWYPVGDALAISGDGKLIATTGSNGIEVWRRGGKKLELLGRHRVPVSGTGERVAWNPTATAFAYAGAGRALILTPNLHLLWSCAFAYASDVAFSPGGDLLVVGDWSKGAALALGVR